MQDRENQERAVEAEEYARKGAPSSLPPLCSATVLTPPSAGKKPPRKKDDLPKPTELMKAREAPLELNKNVGKTVIINAGAGAAGQPGFYCDVCKRTSKDSVGYLDHINGRSRALPSPPLPPLLEELTLSLSRRAQILGG